MEREWISKEEAKKYWPDKPIQEEFIYLFAVKTKNTTNIGLYVKIRIAHV